MRFKLTLTNSKGIVIDTFTLIGSEENRLDGFEKEYNLNLGFDQALLIADISTEIHKDLKRNGY